MRRQVEELQKLEKKKDLYTYGKMARLESDLQAWRTDPRNYVIAVYKDDYFLSEKTIPTRSLWDGADIAGRAPCSYRFKGGMN